MAMKLEIRLGDGRWIEVDDSIFNSWTGPRRLNGGEYRGPVYYLGTNRVAKPYPGGTDDGSGE
jgi:hypothetical protein